MRRIGLGAKNDNMEAYTGFARVYDTFMEETPYDKWCKRIVKILKDNGIKDGLLCELGAGTGEMTRRLRDKGYDMIGVDNSEEMLAVARTKEEKADHGTKTTGYSGGKSAKAGNNGEILYLCQDMREFELYGTVRGIVSVCDSINYITDPDDLTGVFKLVNNYLDPEGLFIFDFNTKHKYRDVIGDTVIAENRDDESFIWENSYYPGESINEYDITFFVREGELFRKFTETHIQRGYTLSEIKKSLAAAGLVFVSAEDSDTGKAPTRASERILVTARECGKA